jgi:phosphonate transport system permease protein
MPSNDPKTGTFELLYRRRRRARGQTTLAWVAVLLSALAVSAWMSDVSPVALLAGLPRAGQYFARLLPDLQWRHLLNGPQTEGSFAYWFYRIDSWLWLLLQTTQMAAALATLLGTALALLLCFPASANLAPNHATYFVFRRILEMFRSVPDLVYALILVWAFGVGPLAGILAIMLHTVGALGKLFAEVVENADMRPWDGVRAAGGTWAQAVRYAIVPQVAPNFLSYVLLRFEINVRGATVIGFVGAGGIGQELYTVISFNYYQEISAIVVLIMLTVSLIDLLSEWLRSRAMQQAVR